ncbi:hypothetical protein [Flavobacterium sp. N3904]|uniref:hypothetical protein n=1 Tax=Flavobacterium sp. N3904 TaxID=2986835 RepID=UPI0022248B25|nr:hypothetical protein [Flavobacterium sp. N3904]
MRSAVCTLFEGNYHYGLAALSNSLYNNGFRGDIFVGYRGNLPPWANSAYENPNLEWDNAKTLKLEEDFKVHFLPLVTDWHLANLKPDFMLNLWATSAKDAESLFYFDPDIVIKCSWLFYEKWANFGVALVHEIISNDCPPNHPKRSIWKEVIDKMNMKVEREVHSYINSGFCGVKKSNIDFLATWSKVIHSFVDSFGFSIKHFEFTNFQPWDIFFAGDQDAFNIAAMCSKAPLSEMGPEAMDFIHGGFTMSHAVGGPKPWNKSFILFALKGIPPSFPDKAYWKNVGLPIATCNKSTIKIKNLSIKIASVIGRFYRKY